MTVTIRDTEYELANSLRVAYKVQGQHNHTPYTKVFSEIGDMTIEDQIGILYAAFECANPLAAQSLKRKDFEDYYLDNFNLTQVMDQLQVVIGGIMGKDLKTTEAESADPQLSLASTAG